jgi:hypothetical protein
VARGQGGRRLVVLLDEFDLLSSQQDAALFRNLRFVIEQVQEVTWIIASSLALYKELQTYESPLFNILKIVDLDRLDAVAAKRLVCDPWTPSAQEGRGRSATLQFLDDAVEAILYETGCLPYFIQLLCSAVVEHVNSVQTNYVTHATVYDVVRKVVQPQSAFYNHLAYLWDMPGSVGKAILLTLLGSADALPSEELYAALDERLLEQGGGFLGNWLLAQYRSSLHSLQVTQAVGWDSANRLTFRIPLFRRLLEGRSQREALWEVTLQEMREQYMREMGNNG